MIIAIISGCCVRRNRMRRRQMQQDTIIIENNPQPSYVTGQPIYTDNVNQGVYPQNNYQQQNAFNEGIINN